MPAPLPPPPLAPPSGGAPPRWAAGLLLGALLLKIVGLEMLAEGWPHHASEGATLLLYAWVGAWLAGSRHAAFMMLCLGGLPWLLDVLAVPPRAFDFESLFWCLTHAYLATLLARSLLGREVVGRGELLDTVSLYLVSGVAFADLYCLVLWAWPGAIGGAGAPGPGLPFPYDVALYFSFVTQATLGYGDVVPVHRVARTIVIAQSLYGVMFTAMVVARMVALHAAHRPRRDG